MFDQVAFVQAFSRYLLCILLLLTQITPRPYKVRNLYEWICFSLVKDKYGSHLQLVTEVIRSDNKVTNLKARNADIEPLYDWNSNKVVQQRLGHDMAILEHIGTVQFPICLCCVLYSIFAFIDFRICHLHCCSLKSCSYRHKVKHYAVSSLSLVSCSEMSERDFRCFHIFPSFEKKVDSYVSSWSKFLVVLPHMGAFAFMNAQHLLATAIEQCAQSNITAASLNKLVALSLIRKLHKKVSERYSKKF